MSLLRPRAALSGGGLDAFGDWALAFRKRDDLLFCWIERGECQLIRPGCRPVAVRQGDFVLIHTSTPFILASDASIVPIDSETTVAATRRMRLTLGSGADRPVTLHAGKFLSARANEDLLAGLFPSVIHILAGDESLGCVRALLAMNEMEARQPGPASEFVIVRLVELVLVEILRSSPLRVDGAATGLLAGLADKVIAKALAAMHREVARGWTVDELASLCGVSRSTCAARFRNVVGMAPSTICFSGGWHSRRMR